MRRESTVGVDTAAMLSSTLLCLAALAVVARAPARYTWRPWAALLVSARRAGAPRRRARPRPTRSSTRAQVIAIFAQDVAHVTFDEPAYMYEYFHPLHLAAWLKLSMHNTFLVPFTLRSLTEALYAAV